MCFAEITWAQNFRKKTEKTSKNSTQSTLSKE